MTRANQKAMGRPREVLKVRINETMIMSKIKTSITGT
jgi:hypothetical protein